MLPFLDVGVTSGQVAAILEASPIVSVVGFQGSGKSKLAETLREDLPGNVRIQTASAWVPRSVSGATLGDATVDPEIVQSMHELERVDGKNCWIVDDAEVMFTYATDPMLASLGDWLRRRRASLVLVRNRFVLEGEGWFHQRQSVLSHNIPTLTMSSAVDQAAVAVATEKFDGPARLQQGEWLASMSGGIPGLMSDLYRYTPEWPTESPHPALLAFARTKWEELELHKPTRQLLVAALHENLLPPLPLLADEARRELGVLMLAGMVSARYAASGNPFNGEFWRMVARLDAQRVPASVRPLDAHRDTAANLELMFGQAGFLDDVREGCGVDGSDDGDLAAALTASFHASAHHPQLVRPLEAVLVGILGRYGLVQVLKAHGIAPPNVPAEQLVALLLQTARSW